MKIISGCLPWATLDIRKKKNTSLMCCFTISTSKRVALRDASCAPHVAAAASWRAQTCYLWFILLINDHFTMRRRRSAQFARQRQAACLAKAELRLLLYNSGKPPGSQDTHKHIYIYIYPCHSCLHLDTPWHFTFVTSRMAQTHTLCPPLPFGRPIQTAQHYCNGKDVSRRSNWGLAGVAWGWISTLRRGESERVAFP